MPSMRSGDRIFSVKPATVANQPADPAIQVYQQIPNVVGTIDKPEEIMHKPYNAGFVTPDGRVYFKLPSVQNEVRDMIAARGPRNPLRRVVHWLGHVVFNMDCGVMSDPHTQHMYCKTCARDVTLKGTFRPVTSA